MNRAQQSGADSFEALAAQLDRAPLGAPQGPELDRLLRELYGPEEAQVAAALAFKPQPVDKLAQQMGRPAAELDSLLSSMADRGLCFQRQRQGQNYYSLLPMLPGLSELQFMGGQVSEHKRRLARLFHDYYQPGTGKALVDAAQPYARVLPVGRAVATGQEILPYEQAEQIIRQADSMALATCYCRHEAELLDQGCGKPKDVCMVFGPFAEFIADKGFGRRADQKTMLQALDRAEQAGLVHVTDNVAQGVSFLCNCCGCCCLFLRTITQLQMPGAVASASYLAQVDSEACTGCGQCLEICQVAAPMEQGEVFQIDPGRCLGCGQCALACPEQAIALERRKQVPQPAENRLQLAERIMNARSGL